MPLDASQAATAAARRSTASIGGLVRDVRVPFDAQLQSHSRQHRGHVVQDRVRCRVWWLPVAKVMP